MQRLMLWRLLIDSMRCQENKILCNANMFGLKTLFTASTVSRRSSAFDI